jgi:Ras-related protein Rab-11A
MFLAGQERFRAITTFYYRDAQGAILVYDLTKKDTFDNCAKWLKELQEKAEHGIKIVLAGNKCDLSQIREVETSTAKDWASRNGLQFFECSAKDGTNVPEVFTTVLKEICGAKSSTIDHSGDESGTTITVSPDTQTKKAGGCCK